MNQFRDISSDHSDAKRRFTVDEFMAMGAAGIFGPDERVELLAGEIFVMSPAGRFHEVLRGYLAQAWAKLATADHLVMAEMQLRISDDVQPVIDIGVVPYALLPPDARGPDMLLVVEIADSSLAIDIGPKAAAYASAGIRDYWVINARTRATLVHREPQADGSYALKFEVASDQVVTPLLVPELATQLNTLPSA